MQCHIFIWELPKSPIDSVPPYIEMQDRWDSIENNDYFSIEGAKDVIRQVGVHNHFTLCSLFPCPCLRLLPPFSIRSRDTLYLDNTLYAHVFIIWKRHCLTLVWASSGAQMQYFKQPDLETPKYRVLKRTAAYQVIAVNPNNLSFMYQWNIPCFVVLECCSYPSFHMQEDVHWGC